MASGSGPGPAPHGVLGTLELPLGLGLLRLSTEGRPTEAEALRIIHHALDSGIRLLDTADTYCLDESDLHYGEELVRKALQSWSGPGDDVRVLTKAGLSRPRGRWVPRARPQSLREAVEGSLRALDVERLFMLLLHVNDPATPFEDSLAMLATLQQEGKVLHLGLCNTSIPEFRQAERHFPVSAIQNELSVMERKAATSGLLELARIQGIPFLAHRPLGGHAKVEKLAGNRAMAPLSKRHGVTPHQAALATLWDLGGHVIPLVGATRIESLDSTLRARQLLLDDVDRTAVAARISFSPTSEALASLDPPATPKGLRSLAPNAPPGSEAEVVLLMGIQGAGKSDLVERYVAAGYERLNRDLLGGSLDDLLPLLAGHLDAGRTRVVLDNTYPTRVSRYPVIRLAHSRRVPVRCVHLATPLRDAHMNVVYRMLDRYGYLPGPDELKELAKNDPNLPPPAAMARWAASFEPPSEDEGFGAVDVIPFQRRPGPPSTGKGLLLDVDGTLRTTRSGEIYPRDPEDVVLLPGRREKLAEWLGRGYQLFFVSNQSGVASGKLTAEEARLCFDRTIQLLGLPVADVAYCPHPAFPAGCFCRKPLPGMGLMLARRHGLDLESLVMVGDMDSDEDFARALGARYVAAPEFFGE